MRKTLCMAAAVAALAVTGCSERAEAPEVVSARTCGLCHDLPPRDRAHLYHVDSLGYRCSYCHAGYEADSARGIFSVNNVTHMNGDTDVVFTPPWNDSGKAAYDKSTMQCSNVYCHGGIPQGTHATVAWNADSIDRSCGACHNLSTNTADSTSIYTFHYGHALKRYPATGTPLVGGNVNKCYNCHGGAYNMASATVDTATHINGVFDPGLCSACHLWNTWQEYKLQNPAAKMLAGPRSPLSMLPR